MLCAFTAHFDAFGFGDAGENPVEGVWGHRSDEHLVSQTTKEGVIAQRVGVEVGRGDQLELKGKRELRSVGQLQVVDAAGEGHNPAVHEFVRGDLLTAEVVNHQDAVVGEHLDRRRVDARHGVEGEVDHVGAELTTDDHEGAVADDPARVKTMGLLFGRGVNRRVEDRDDRAVDFDHSRYQNLIFMDLDHAFGKRCLTGTGRTVEEDGAVVHEGGAQGIEHRVLDHQVGERGANVLAVDLQNGFLGFDNGDVLLQRHRKIAGVLRRG